MTEPAKKASWIRRVIRACWAAGAFFAVGYFPTLVLRGDPRVSMVVAAILAIPFGAKAATVRRGILRGALLGTMAGMAITGAIVSLRMQPLPPIVAVTCVTLPLGTAATATTGLEVAAAVAFCSAMASPYGHHLPGQLTATYLLATIVLCAAAAGVLSRLAQKRRRAVERRWGLPP